LLDLLLQILRQRDAKGLLGELNVRGDTLQEGAEIAFAHGDRKVES
jgi:hypothetical protein